MSGHPTRQELARAFGATDIVSERGDEGVARVKELTKGIGADSAQYGRSQSIPAARAVAASLNPRRV